MKLILHSLLLLTIFTGEASGKNWLRKKFICIVGRGIRTFSCSCWILILCVCARATCFINGGPLAFHFVHTGAFTKQKTMWNCWPLQFGFDGKEEREIVHAKRPKKTLYRDFWFWFFDKWTYTEQKTNATNCERKPTGKMWKMSPATRLNLSWQNNRVPSIYQSIKSDLFNCSFWSPTLYRMSCLSCLTTFHTHTYTEHTHTSVTKIYNHSNTYIERKYAWYCCFVSQKSSMACITCNYHHIKPNVCSN